MIQLVESRSLCGKPNDDEKQDKETVTAGDGQNTDPQSMDYPKGLPKWTTLKWTTHENTVPNEYYLMF